MPYSRYYAWRSTWTFLTSFAYNWGGSSSEIRPYSLFIFPTNMTESNFPTGDEYKNCYALRVIDTGGLGWYALILEYESDTSKWLSTGLTLDGNIEAE